MNSIFPHTVQLNGSIYTKDTDFGSLPFLDKDTQEFLSEWFDNNAIIRVKTSGSTGTPKVLEVQKKHLLASAKSTCEHLGLNQETNALLCLPTAFIGGKMMVVRAIFSGYNLIVGDSSKNPFQTIKEQIDFVAMTPYQFSFSSNESFEKLTKVKHILLGGAAVSNERIETAKQLKGNVYETFGMTETLSHIALKNLKKETCFHVLAPSTCSISKENQLIIRSPHLAIEELITNDIIDLIDHKTFKWLGRKDFVINSGGIKMHPEKMEQEISKQSNIAQENLLITSIPDDILGEKVVLCTTLRDYPFDFSHLNKYEIPKKVYELDAFIHTQNGKINRIETRKKLLKQIY